MRRYTAYPSPGEKNSLRYLYQTVSLARVIKNFVLIQLCRYSPSFNFKNAVYRYLLGMKVGKNASVALMVMMDVFFPELISIGENTIIGYNTVILGHEYLIREYRKGPVEIGSNVMIGANCTLLPGIKIGDNSVVSAGSLVNRDIPANCMAGGVPVRILRTNPHIREVTI